MSGPSPEISVVIPVYNGEGTLRRCLDSVMGQDYPGSWEVVVADNASTDATPEILADYPVTRVEALPRGRPVARNRGIAASRGDWIAFLDADCWAAPDWLRRFLQCVRRGGWDLAGGEVLLDRPLEDLGPLELHDYVKTFTFAQFVERYHFPCTSSAILRRAVWEQVGGFDERLVNSEDYEWGRRAWRAGFTLGFCSEARAYTDPRATLRSVLEREFRFGYGCAQVGALHGEPEQITWWRPARYRPPLSFLTSRAPAPVRRLEWSRRLAFLALYWAGYFVREAGNLRGWWASRKGATG